MFSLKISIPSHVTFIIVIRIFGRLWSSWMNHHKIYKKKKTANNNKHRGALKIGSRVYNILRKYFIYIREHSQSLTQTAQTQNINWNIEA